jgi:hypothetical protein
MKRTQRTSTTSLIGWLFAGSYLLLSCSQQTSDGPAAQSAGGQMVALGGAGSGGGGSGGVATGTAGGGAANAGAGAGGTAGVMELGGAGAGGSAGAGGVTGQVPGGLTFQKITVHERFLAESASIGDFNHDGNPDITSGRRWYEGPAFTVEHPFRGGHEELPPEEPNDGVSDDWADFVYDVNADGWDDIIVIASPDTTSALTDDPITDGSGYWFENPGATASEMWTKHLINDDLRMEQRQLVDVTGDGYPEILGGQLASKTKGYYQADAADKTAPWLFHPITREYDFYGGGWIHGIGAGDVDGDGKQDLLERAGAWLQRDGAEWEFYNVGFNYNDELGTQGNLGGAHMFAYDIDDDGDADVISGLNSHGWGFAWFEQTSPGMFTKHMIFDTPEQAEMYQGVAFSQLHAMALADMDGDGLQDIVTGKGFYVHPPVFNDPDYDGTPFVYVFKLVRDATGAHFEPHVVDEQTGTGRHLTVGHLNHDGTLDFVIGGKKGLFVYLQDPI